MKKKRYFAGIGLAFMATLAMCVLWRGTDEKEYKEKSVPVLQEEYKNVESKYVEETIEEIVISEEMYGEILQVILEENREEVAEFFDRYALGRRWVDVSCFDFTGDGEMEIIFSYAYVETAGVIAYNYVYDAEGSKLFEFVSDHTDGLEIYEDTDTFYIQNHIHLAAHHDITIYEEITQKEGWNVEVVLAEWDTRYQLARDENAQTGYNVYGNFTPEEETALMIKNYYEGMVKVFHEKEANGDAEQLRQYAQIYENLEKREVVYLGYLYDLEEGINWREE